MRCASASATGQEGFPDHYGRVVVGVIGNGVSGLRGNGLHQTADHGAVLKAGGVTVLSLRNESLINTSKALL